MGGAGQTLKRTTTNLSSVFHRVSPVLQIIRLESLMSLLATSRHQIHALTKIRLKSNEQYRLSQLNNSSRLSMGVPAVQSHVKADWAGLQQLELQLCCFVWQQMLSMS